MSKQGTFKWIVVIGLVGFVVGGTVVLYRAVMPSDGDTKQGRPSFRMGPPQPLSAYRPASKDTLDKGRKLYRQHCMLCHGTTGEGDGPGARNLAPRPTPYIWGKFRYGNQFPDIIRTITRGSPNRRSGMIAWNWMPKAQREALAHYVLSMSVNNAKKRRMVSGTSK